MARLVSGLFPGILQLSCRSCEQDLLLAFAAGYCWWRGGLLCLVCDIFIRPLVEFPVTFLEASLAGRSRQKLEQPLGPEWKLPAGASSLQVRNWYFPTCLGLRESKGLVPARSSSARTVTWSVGYHRTQPGTCHCPSGHGQEAASRVVFPCVLRVTPVWYSRVHEGRRRPAGNRRLSGQAPQAALGESQRWESYRICLS